LGDHDAGALPAQRLGAALADVAVPADDRDLPCEHHVGGAADAVHQRVATAVEVVELRLRDRVVHVDRGEQQRAGVLHLVQSVHHQYSSGDSPFQGNTGWPAAAIAAAAWAWVEKMLHDAHRTRAPSATSVSISTAVWIVMCSEPVIRAPASG